jgi:hypothetical protein
MTTVSRGPNPIWFFNNQTGSVLDPTYYAFFLENVSPYNFQNVYEDPAGTIPWANPIEFAASGGLPDNLYFDDSLVYRIEIRQGPLRTSPLIFNPIQNFQTGTGNETANTLTTSENMITNPQFNDVYFMTGGSITLATAGTYNIALGWNLILTGTGSTTVTQGFNAGSSNIQGNPATFLTFASSGWTSVVLEQTFTNNGSIYDLGSIAVAFNAEASGSTINVPVNYVPSTGSSVAIHTFPVTAGSFNPYAYAVNITTSTNSDTDGSAFVNINFTLPSSGTISLSNIQITGQSSALSSGFNPATDAPPYQEITYQRMVDHEFNVYRNALSKQSKNSILTGWNFALNPYQFVSTSNANRAFNGYIADQTILIQQNYVANGTGNNVATARSTFNTDNEALQVTAVTAHNQFALIQYIDPVIARPYWNQNLSCYIKAFINTSHSTSVTFKMRLFYKAGLPNTISQTDPIASWTENGDPVFAAGYTGIAPPNDQVYTISSVNTATGNNEFTFDSIPLPSSTNANMTLGIMVYTTSNMNQNATADILFFNDISLVRNDFALPTQPQTFNEVLQQCEFYWESSYDIGALPGDVNSHGVITRLQHALQTSGSPNTLGFVTRPFWLEFRTMKRSNSYATVLYSDATGASGNVDTFITNGGVSVGAADLATSGNWTAENPGQKNLEFTTSNATATNTTNLGGGFNSPGGYIQFHYTIDARLGR